MLNCWIRSRDSSKWAQALFRLTPAILYLLHIWCLCDCVQHLHHYIISSHIKQCLMILKWILVCNKMKRLSWGGRLLSQFCAILQWSCWCLFSVLFDDETGLSKLPQTLFSCILFNILINCLILQASLNKLDFFIIILMRLLLMAPTDNTHVDKMQM